MQVPSHDRDPHTTTKTDGDWTAIEHYGVPVVRFTADVVILTTGGWRHRNGDYSMRQKDRMNQASNQYGLGYKVLQRDGEWFIQIGPVAEIPFEDGIGLKRNKPCT